ncbi:MULTISPECIES: hypothetical protein [unclassified Streptomyces]|uniref:hypothetical protein n=1 Tax=unclassified Streptomyces TaxID=2593676 RepID=UPI002DDAA25E|nr:MULTISPECIES: hypothetical protein [unclassified Streptomyces]WSA94373.1 hypothetical protein OIE63_24440 [Streptomyces sp. NBC_01795]WSB78791.1 hypothetical protein OHB04_25555 [Streptomyces sp. NBC_01775]WSS13005.1 hypothetical protein OG533_14675 [Streptomyces sp. NBC_01186]WSS41789.1 hypothetical protein OG220_15205 [Streptomyces sp. NBC_01187]
MPRGRYSLHDPHDHTPLGEEHFHCATGPSGWRYVSQLTTPTGEHAGSVDLTLDELGRPLRLELHAASWQVRGAALEGVTWVRTDPTGEHAQEGNVAAHSFTGASPAFLVATSRLLRPAPGDRATRIRLVALTPPVLAPRTLDQSWALLNSEAHATDNGPLVVENYQVNDLETGEQHAVHLAGDVVLAAPGIELEDLETPPSTFT